jgi:hypothetical protein
MIVTLRSHGRMVYMPIVQSVAADLPVHKQVLSPSVRLQPPRVPSKSLLTADESTDVTNIRTLTYAAVARVTIRRMRMKCDISSIAP